MDGNGESDPSAPASERHGLWHRLRNYFLTGIVVAAPVGITLYLLWAFIAFVDNAVTPLIPERYNPESYLPFGLPGLGVVVLVLALTILGALTANLVGRSMIRIGDKIFDRMPIVRSIYSTLKQVFETVISAKSTSFKEVVLVEYPRPGQWSLAFITSESRSEIQERTKEDVVAVFVPMTPAPTGGFLVFVPKSDLIVLDMTVDEGMKFIFSAGLVPPSSVAARTIPPPKVARDLSPTADI